jgi:hypothetical protein
LRTTLEKVISNDPDRAVVTGARVVLIQSELKQIGPNDKNLTALGKQLLSTDPQLRLEALEALGYLGDYAKAYFNEIKALAEGVDPKEADPTKIKPADVALAVKAIWVLAGMESEHPKTFPVISNLKSHKTEIIKVTADNAYKYMTLDKKDADVKNIKKDDK